MIIANRIEIPGVRLDALNGAIAGDVVSLAPRVELVQERMAALGGVAPMAEQTHTAIAYRYATVAAGGASAQPSAVGRVVLAVGLYTFSIERGGNTWTARFLAVDPTVAARLHRGSEAERRACVRSIAARWLRYRDPMDAHLPFVGGKPVERPVTDEMRGELATRGRTPSSFSSADFGGSR